MKTSTFAIIFWNVWAYAQNGKIDDGSKLIQRLSELIDVHAPDVFGLNEVLINRHDNSSLVVEFLKNRGYYCHFALISPIDDTWHVGNLVATKSKPKKICEHILGPDTQALRRGYGGYSIKAIEVELEINNIPLTILLNYLSSLWPLDWGTHNTHRKSYEQVVSKIVGKNLIIGGDFNETKYMLPWLRLPKYLKRETGTLLNPTWRLNGKKRYVFLANFDNLVYSEEANLKLKKFEILNRYPSDHTPLLALFYLNSH